MRLAATVGAVGIAAGSLVLDPHFSAIARAMRPPPPYFLFGSRTFLAILAGFIIGGVLVAVERLEVSRNRELWSAFQRTPVLQRWLNTDCLRLMAKSAVWFAAPLLVAMAVLTVLAELSLVPLAAGLSGSVAVFESGFSRLAQELEMENSDQRNA